MSYKLYYFNFRGRAEVIRIILAQAGVKYEDVRFEAEQWAKEYKPGELVMFTVERFESAYFLKAMPFGSAPVLEVDGTKIAGSVNILRFVGKRFGKYETDAIALWGRRCAMNRI